MAQIFHRSSNVIARVGLLGMPVALVGAAALFGLLYRASYFTKVFHPRHQPVPFSHKQHVGGLGLDCRYCHDSVEKSPFAGMPATETCMHCHSQIWADSPLLQPVRDSYRDDRSLAWLRVNQLPDHVYFDHSIHVHKGVGCDTCHGRVDEMALTYRRHALTMKWCLDCHEAPQRYLRPREQVWNPRWRAPAPGEQEALGRMLMQRYGVHVDGLADCYVCHR